MDIAGVDAFMGIFGFKRASPTDEELKINEIRNTNITRKCRLCQNVITLRVRDVDFQKWQNGTHIQNAMPYLSIDKRKLLISGICGPCFDNTMEEEYDEDSL
jgi:hypothetical protein